MKNTSALRAWPRLLSLFLTAGLLAAGAAFAPDDAYAVPEVSAVRLTDVTTSSFSVIWMTDVEATPSVDVYTDAAMTNRITDNVRITPMPGADHETVSAAKKKGVMKVMVSGLKPSASYFARAVTADPANASNVGYSAVYEVITASAVIPYKYANGSLTGFFNDIVSFRIYLQPQDADIKPGLGDIVVFESPASRYPISAFARSGSNAPEGIIDLNNIFGNDGLSAEAIGGEKAVLRAYRGTLLSTLLHYRKVAVKDTALKASEPVTGFFADINLDGSVNDDDFILFKGQYRTMPADGSYNPDYNFVDDAGGKVDAREFSRFANEYGRTGIH
ncbi:MAG: hypothetical protein HZB85_00835 [Deltaproteobacteria bacterium]|nr:hypothetical protein [Deltaproteobacteria bacterium]